MRPLLVEGFALTDSAQPDREPRQFVPADSPASAVEALQGLVRARSEIREAHVVGMRLDRRARAVPTIVLLSEDPTITATLEEELRRIFNSPVRPGIVVLTDVDDELIHVRSLGGELKRGEKRFPWWLLFLGV
jgi:hypothetical protein